MKEATLTFDNIRTQPSRAALFKEVKLRLHPDKHTSVTKEKATVVFHQVLQKLSRGMSTCCECEMLSGKLKYLAFFSFERA